MAHKTRAWIFIFWFLGLICAFVSSQQCEVSLTFPLESSERTIRLTKDTTGAIIKVSCDTPPTTNVVTVLTFTDPTGILTDTENVKQVTIQAGQLCTEFGFNFVSSDIMSETFSVTLTSSDTNVATVASGQDTLTFNLENVPEVSFASPREYSGENGDIITVVLTRTAPLDGPISLNVRETGSSYLTGSPAIAQFDDGEATASVMFTINQVSATDLQAQLIMGGTSDNFLVTRDTTQSSAVIDIIAQPIVTVARASISLPQSLTMAQFQVISTRASTEDIVINLAYTDTNGIVTTQTPTITIPAGATTGTLNLLVDLAGHELQRFTVALSSVAQTMASIGTARTTTYTVAEAGTIIISIQQRAYSTVEGDIIEINLISSAPAQSTLIIELSGDVSQFGALPDAMITAGRSSTSLRVSILSDGITEMQTVSTISFRSLTPGAIVAPGAESVTVIIADAPAIIVPGTGTGTGTGTDTGTGTGGTNTGGDGLSSGAIAGIVVGAVGALIIFIFIAMIFGLAVMTSDRRSFGARRGPVGYYPRSYVPEVYSVPY